MNILIGADIVPTNSNIELFKNGQAEELVGKKLLNLLRRSDFTIMNLEVPLTDFLAPIAKCGPNLIAPCNAVIGMKAMGIHAVTLANNHILDQGFQGVKQTCNTLESHGIKFLGVGNTIQDAAKPLIIKIENKKIGFYACAEHEFSINNDDLLGANPFDPLESLDHIFELKQACDYVIVLYHGGKEHYRYPSPQLQKTCRKIIDKGANLIICQHSHCIGCKEEWNGGTIVYGQGNFLFDRSESVFWKDGLLVQINNNFSISYIPVVKDREKVRLATCEKSTEILTKFDERSKTILEKGAVEKLYLNFARSSLDGYLNRISGKQKSITLKVLNKLTKNRFNSYILKRKYDKKSLLAIQNCLECEAHRELFLKGVKSFDK